VARRWLICGGSWAVGTVLVFLLLNPILAAFVSIMGATVAGVAVAAADWDKHSTFEERELARSRKRAARWEQNKDVRERDRRRWEAHQARQARKAQKP
jgi:hypothetical protein